MLLRLAIASYSAPSRLALDAHDSPRKAPFMTFRGIKRLKLEPNPPGVTDVRQKNLALATFVLCDRLDFYGLPDAGLEIGAGICLVYRNLKQVAASENDNRRADFY